MIKSAAKASIRLVHCIEKTLWLSIFGSGRVCVKSLIFVNLVVDLTLLSYIIKDASHSYDIKFSILNAHKGFNTSLLVLNLALKLFLNSKIFMSICYDFRTLYIFHKPNTYLCSVKHSDLKVG